MYERLAGIKNRHLGVRDASGYAKGFAQNFVGIGGTFVQNKGPFYTRTYGVVALFDVLAFCHTTSSLFRYYSGISSSKGRFFFPPRHLTSVKDLERILNIFFRVACAQAPAHFLWGNWMGGCGFESSVLRYFPVPVLQLGGETWQVGKGVRGLAQTDISSNLPCG